MKLVHWLNIEDASLPGRRFLPVSKKKKKRKKAQRNDLSSDRRLIPTIHYTRACFFFLFGLWSLSSFTKAPRFLCNLITITLITIPSSRATILVSHSAHISLESQRMKFNAVHFCKCPPLLSAIWKIYSLEFLEWSPFDIFHSWRVYRIPLYAGRRWSLKSMVRRFRCWFTP